METWSSEKLSYHLRGCALNDPRSQIAIYNYLMADAGSFCTNYSRSREDVQEIVHDGLIKIFREIPRFKPSYENLVISFRCWVRRILIHTAIDHFRRNRKHRVLIALDINTNILSKTPSDALEKLAEEDLYEAIGEVSPGCQSVLKLFALEGFDHQEIASSLRISVGTSKSNLFKARKQLRRIISHHNAY